MWGRPREGVVALPHTSFLSGHWVCVKLPSSARASGTETGEELGSVKELSKDALCFWARSESWAQTVRLLCGSETILFTSPSLGGLRDCGTGPGTTQIFNRAPHFP